MARAPTLVLLVVASHAILFAPHAVGQQWIRQVGGPGEDFARAVAVDSAGGVYVAGQTGSPLAPPLQGSVDAWLALYDASGQQQWIRQFGTPSTESADAAVGADLGGVFVTGYSAGMLGGTLQSRPWLIRYNAAGAQVWARQLEVDLMNGSGKGLASDAADGVFMTGLLFAPSPGEVAFIARYDAAGTRLWYDLIGAHRTYSLAACADGEGGAFIAGWTNNLGLGGGQTTPRDAWIARYAGDGTRLWIFQFGSGGDDLVQGLAPDGAGGVYATGKTSGSLGGANSGGEDIWLARFNAAGAQLWARQFGTASHDNSVAATPDGQGGVFIGGATEQPLVNPGSTEGTALIARYDASGTQLWLEQFGPIPPSTAAVLGLVGDGAAGFFASGVSLGGFGGPSAGSYDAWLGHWSTGCLPDLTTTALPGSPGYGVPNGVINNDDFFYYLIIFSAGC